MVKRTKHEIPDRHLFRQEVQDVIPLKMPVTTESKAPHTSNHKLRANKLSINAIHGLSPLKDKDAATGMQDDSSHRKDGVQKRIIQKLKRGQFRINHELDLHHMNLETAQAALLDFIASTPRGKLECVRIIHGKGLRSTNGPRLKLMTWQLLRDHPQVLAFTTCKPAKGGSGAVEVLLKST